MENKKIFISWEAGEEKKQLNAMKLVIVFAIILGASAYSFYTRDWIPGITIIFLALALFWYLVASPKTLHFELSDRGIFIEGRLYPFANLQSYWAEASGSALYFISKSKLSPVIPVLLGDKKPEEVTKFFPKTLIKIERSDRDSADRVAAFLHK